MQFFLNEENLQCKSCKPLTDNDKKEKSTKILKINGSVILVNRKILRNSK